MLHEKNIEKIDKVITAKKNRGSKKRHGLVFHKDTWSSMSDTASSYDLSISKYIETLHDLYLRTAESKY